MEITQCLYKYHFRKVFPNKQRQNNRPKAFFIPSAILFKRIEHLPLDAKTVIVMKEACLSASLCY